MSPLSSAARCATAAAAGLALIVGGCGQVTPGEPAGAEQTSTAAESAAPEGGAAGAGATGTAAATTSPGTPAPSPGPGATPGCAELVEPVHRLVTGGGDTEADSAEVRRRAGGVEDNALSAVASRISGLALQPVVDPAALDNQWGQFRQLCDLD